VLWRLSKPHAGSTTVLVDELDPDDERYPATN
jgi:hypothetical protein